MSAALRPDRTDAVSLDDEVRRIESLLRHERGTDGDDRLAAPAARATGLAGLAALFGLSPFETDLLLLAAGVELDGRVAQLVAELTGGDGSLDPRPTFGLALSRLPDGHWDALSPARPLRRWALVTFAAGPTLTTRRIGVDEQVLHALTGTAGGFGELDGFLAHVTDEVTLAPSHAGLAEVAATTLTGTTSALARLVADGGTAATDVAAAVAGLLGRTPVLVRADGLPSAGPELARFARLLDRHLLIHDGLPVLLEDHPTLVEQLVAPVVLTTVDGRPPLGRTELRWTVEHLAAPERAALWSAALGHPDPGPDGTDDGGARGEDAAESLHSALDEVAAQHRFDAATIAAIAEELRAGGAPGAAALRAACRARGRVALDGLAARVDVRAGWGDLVLPEGAAGMLRAVVDAVRHRTLVHHRWGFADSSTRGLGVTALFAGDSGTGKTMAAEVIARELDVDLFRVDLASVVDKYVGETEKHLARLFDAAERSGAVLLFDEADALFGKRGEVRDAHDRYANLEVSYLLQRMETYRGLAVLTTNLRSNVDRAFMRRLRFVVEFPFPDERLRARIWAGAFPPATPTTGIDPDALARLRVAGGSIRAIALTAAVAAAAEGAPVRPDHVLHAARLEYAKGDRALSHAETVAVTGGGR